MTDLEDIHHVTVSGKRVEVSPKLLGYNPYRQDMSVKCPDCDAPPGCFCVASRHRPRKGGG